MHKKRKNLMGRMKHNVAEAAAGQCPDSNELKGDNIPDHKMFHKAPKAKKGKKGKMKAKMGKKAHMKRNVKAKMKRRNAKAKMKHRNAQASQWHLVKKNNGECKCTQNLRRRLSLRKFTTQSECENHRSGC
jgi:hypothetical protein